MHYSKAQVIAILVMGVSFFIAATLMILPLPSFATWFHPAWVELTLCFWVLALPERFSLIAVWFIGLLLDMLMGTLLGEHALMLTLIAYGLINFYQQIRMFPLWQQGLCIFLILSLYQITLFWLQTITGQKPNLALFWVNPCLSMCFWPIITLLLQSYAKKYLEI